MKGIFTINWEQRLFVEDFISWKICHFLKNVQSIEFIWNYVTLDILIQKNCSWCKILENFLVKFWFDMFGQKFAWVILFVECMLHGLCYLKYVRNAKLKFEGNDSVATCIVLEDFKKSPANHNAIVRRTECKNHFPLKKGMQTKFLNWKF